MAIRSASPHRFGHRGDHLFPHRPVTSPASSPAAKRLRAAGLRVTSIRIATLRLAPEALAIHGQLTPVGLHALAVRHGYTFCPPAFHQVLRCLHAARLLPCAPSFARCHEPGDKRSSTCSSRRVPHAR